MHHVAVISIERGAVSARKTRWVVETEGCSAA